MPDQGEPADSAFLFQLQEALCSQALVPLRDFNHLDICWEEAQRALGNPGSSWNVQLLESGNTEGVQSVGHEHERANCGC